MFWLSALLYFPFCQQSQKFPFFCSISRATLEDTFKCKWTPLLRNNAYSFFHRCHCSSSPRFVCSNLSRDWTFIPLLWVGSVVRHISLRCRSSDFLFKSTKWICLKLNEARNPRLRTKNSNRLGHFILPSRLASPPPPLRETNCMAADQWACFKKDPTRGLTLASASTLTEEASFIKRLRQSLRWKRLIVTAAAKFPTQFNQRKQLHLYTAVRLPTSSNVPAPHTPQYTRHSNSR